MLIWGTPIFTGLLILLGLNGCWSIPKAYKMILNLANLKGMSTKDTSDILYAFGILLIFINAMTQVTSI
ncbi:MAG: hypothetical protein ACI8Q1_001135 [Parvicella sp.]|jgi:hypothetical protein